MNNLSLVRSKLPMPILMLRRKTGWLREIRMIVIGANASLHVFERIEDISLAASSIRPTGLAILELDCADLQRSCQLIIDLTQLGWRAAVIGNEDLLPVELNLRSCGAVAIVTSRIDLDKVWSIIEKTMELRPAIAMNWRDELFSRLPWPKRSGDSIANLTYSKDIL